MNAKTTASPAGLYGVPLLVAWTGMNTYWVDSCDMPIASKPTRLPAGQAEVSGTPVSQPEKGLPADQSEVRPGVPVSQPENGEPASQSEVRPGVPVAHRKHGEPSRN